MAKTVYIKTALTGGGADALDGIDGAMLVDQDVALVYVANTLYFYQLDATSGASEDSPSVIAPDTNAGDKRWILQAVRGEQLVSEGDATISGSLTVSSDLTVSGNLVVDTNVLYVDSGNNNVGIGTTGPEKIFHIQKAGVGSNGLQVILEGYGEGASSAVYLVMRRSNSDSKGVKETTVDGQEFGLFDFYGVNSDKNFYRSAVVLVVQDGSAGTTYIPSRFEFWTSDGVSAVKKRLIIDSNGNVGIGTTDQFGSGAGVFALANASTNPTSNPTNAIVLFAKDYDDGDGAASSELFVRDEDGNETNLSPHTFELYQPDPTDPFPWTYHSTNYLIGKKINVDMSGAIRELEKLTGKKFIYVEDVERVPLSKHIKDKKEVLIKKWQEENAKEVEITLEEAVEEVEVEVEDREQVVGKEKRYRFENGKVVEEEVLVYGKKKEKQKRLKEGVRLDEKTGKFYRKVVPSRKEALKALKQNPKFRVRRWLKERLRRERGE